MGGGGAYLCPSMVHPSVWSGLVANGSDRDIARYAAAGARTTPSLIHARMTQSTPSLAMMLRASRLVYLYLTLAASCVASQQMLRDRQLSTPLGKLKEPALSLAKLFKKATYSKVPKMQGDFVSILTHPDPSL